MNSLQRLFRRHFAEFTARYQADYARRVGHSGLQQIIRAVERFLECGDCCKGVARIRCTNPDCRAEYFRPFSCKVFHLCPSCSQKRTLLFGEYMSERLLLRLPHRQMLFTFPKLLHGFFRHHRTLYGEIARQVYAMIRKFYNAAAGCRVHRAAVIAYASAAEFARVIQSASSRHRTGRGFGHNGRFVHILRLDFGKHSQYFRLEAAKPMGQRIQNVRVKTGTGAYEPIDPEAVYKVVVNNFMAAGGDRYDTLKEAAGKYE
jgi:hypothetical protein